MTKLITSVAAMRLVEQGKLSLSDEVAKYLPQAAHITVKTESGAVPARQKMTVKHLISMQGGYNYVAPGDDISEAVRNNPNASTYELAHVLLKRPLEFEPGTRFSYSLCYDVLGAVMEVASGMSLGEFFRKEIFEPLGMTETTFDVNQAVRNRLINEYSWDEENLKVKQLIPATNVYIFTPKYESAGAGLVSSFDDYFKFVTAIINGGTTKDGYRLISKESLDAMCDRYMTDEMLQAYNRYQQWGCGYSFGIRVQLEKDMCPPGMDTGVFEITGAAGSYAHFDLDNNLALLYFQHAIRIPGFSEVVHHEIRDMVYETILK